MAIVAGFDVHRAQITFDALDRVTGKVSRGRMAGSPEAVREWAEGFAVRRSTWRWRRARVGCLCARRWAKRGLSRSLAEPVETSALRGSKRRAKTDRADARWLRTLLAEGRLPEAWVPPPQVREWRTRTRLRKTLVDERTRWLARVQATLFHHGVVGVPDKLLSGQGRAFLAGLELPDSALERIEVALALIEAIDHQLAPLEKELRQLARRQPGCRALMAHYGIGELTAPTILSELGDVPPPVQLAQGGALRRHRHRRAPLRPPLPGRQADQTGLAAAALGALSVSPGGLPSHPAGPGSLPGAQRARALAPPRFVDDRRKLARRCFTPCANSAPTPTRPSTET